MLHSYLLGIISCLSGAYAFYDSSSDIVKLDPSNFNSLVVNSGELWVVEFYAPWCGPCKKLVPEFTKAAKDLKGIANVGAVDGDENDDLREEYGVLGFPTIKIFTGNKHTTYKGKRTAEGIVDAAVKVAKEEKSHKKMRSVRHRNRCHNLRHFARLLFSPQQIPRWRYD